MVDSDAAALLNLVRSQLLALRSHHFRRLSFAGPLESAFEQRLAPSRSKRLYLEGWILVGMYCSLIIADYQTLGERFRFALLVRCLFALPLLCIANDSLRHNPRKLFREGSVVLTTLLVTITDVVLWADVNAVISATVVVSLVVSLIVSSVVMRLRFPYAVASIAGTLATAVGFLVHDRLLSSTQKTNTFIPVLIGTIFTLAASYSLEREERLSFLLQIGNELQQEELQSLNVKLERLSSQDGLTGLANRAAFEERFHRTWEEATAARTPFSLILIDIDHFKTVNDTQGHQYGDEVLKRVAVLTREALRGTTDFAARYGGEEFVVLLPNTQPAAAHAVAERIRSLVQLAGGPSGSDSPWAMWTTVSCGIASLETTIGRNARDLLRDADRALYRAKATGRNCVCAASEEIESTALALECQTT